ncbi:perlucin-like protein [Saccostrea cucullata]|uniref:perlucin-like protein n=1 Tax=Saccostrea cuccullata TaxID=36930 RepID=UPI002ED0528D
MGLRSCGVACLETLPICAGFLYNRRSKSCKLMRLYLDKRFLTVPFDGWKFYYDTKACDPGWTPYNGHCYLLGNSLLTWTTSQVQCQAYGGYVLEVESVEENMWITEIFLPIPDNECSEWRFCNVWIGATDSDIEGTFTWIRNKEELTYLPWDVGQPDDKNGQDCIRLNSSGRWKDASCKDNNRMNYICEKNSS